MRPSGSLLLLLFVGALAACKTPRPTDTGLTVPPEAVRNTSPPPPPVSLGPGDVVEIRVYQEPDLTGAYRLSPEGTVDFPLCGKVQLTGKTSSQAADTLIACLAKGYIRNPQVTVLVREYNSQKIFVFGEVQKPGTFPYESNMSIVQAITLAGGFTKQAARNYTNVTRTVEGKELKIRVPVEEIGQGRERNFVLQPGDIIFVPESFF
jgi:polysaccharide export outer membrane protein